MVPCNQFYKKLIALRGEQSRQTVAAAIGISVSAITMYENGKRIPRDEIKMRLAEYYGVSVQELFFDYLLEKNNNKGTEKDGEI